VRTDGDRVRKRACSVAHQSGLLPTRKPVTPKRRASVSPRTGHCEKLARENPTMPHSQRSAGSHNNLGNLHGETGDTKRRGQLRQITWPIPRKMEREHPVTAFASALAESQTIGGYFFCKAKPMTPKRRSPVTQSLLDIRRETGAERIRWCDICQQSGGSYATLAIHYRRQNPADEVAPVLEKAALRLESLSASATTYDGPRVSSQLAFG